MSEQIDQLATALAKAQGEMQVAEKNKKNPFFKSNYADFESIIAATRPALSKYGLSVAQVPSILEDGSSYLMTILMHSSGQWIKSCAKHNPPKQDVQSLSSYNTYLKRMCYESIVCVATGDDDGELASAPYRNEPSEPLCTEKQYSLLSSAFDDQEVADILKTYKISNLDQLTFKQATVELNKLV